MSLRLGVYHNGVPFPFPCYLIRFIGLSCMKATTMYCVLEVSAYLLEPAHSLKLIPI